MALASSPRNPHQGDPGGAPHLAGGGRPGARRCGADLWAPLPSPSPYSLNARSRGALLRDAPLLRDAIEPHGRAGPHDSPQRPPDLLKQLSVLQKTIVGLNARSRGALRDEPLLRDAIDPQ